MDRTEERFAQVVKEHRSTIYTVCYMFSKDADEVPDLFQEVLVNVWRGFGGFERRSDVRTWIYRVALNTCISAERTKRRRAAIPLSVDVDLFSGGDDDSGQVALLHDRIMKLRPFDRAIVLLWLENMSYEEIGAVVGITAKNVSVRLYRIKEQLKRMSDQ